ncbi:MAG: phosphate signaling complex protein PhoU [Symbiobacteriaceae bacterium]|nr:phosphate signaling complex protein PhoU [Symbiobacteriaceae bacterium]
MRSRFEEQLKNLKDALIEMGGMIVQAITSANEALIGQNMELAQWTIDFDLKIDDKEKEIEDLCLKILLQQQPVARDLRLISAVLKMITDLERIGDQAADISEIVVYLVDKTYIKKLEHIPQMAATTMKMVSDSIDAFVQDDLNLARRVITADDEVDELFNVVKAELISLIHKDVNNGDQALDLLMIAKYFERIGDHATNLAEWVVFSHTGTHKYFPDEE